MNWNESNRGTSGEQKEQNLCKYFNLSFVILLIINGANAVCQWPSDKHDKCHHKQKRGNHHICRDDIEDTKITVFDINQVDTNQVVGSLE